MTAQKHKLSLIAGVVAALSWCLADILLVGFIPRPEAFPLLSQQLAPQIDSELAVLMLDGSPQRLLWGVYFATFSVVLYVLALFGVWDFLTARRGRAAIIFLLLLGYALSPLGHAGFAYVGLQAQSLLRIPPEFLDAPVANFNLFVQLLHAHWVASVGASALGWLAVAVLTVAGKTRLPRWAVCFNPVPVAVLIVLVCTPLRNHIWATLVGSATFNIAQLIFFVSALLIPARPVAAHPH
jgi:hypothetical protein